jgi:hypothetical protein
MKGTMSELELSILRQRALEALKQKARRGESRHLLVLDALMAENDIYHAPGDASISPQRLRNAFLPE